MAQITIRLTEDQLDTAVKALYIAARTSTTYGKHDEARDFSLLRQTIQRDLIDETAKFLISASDAEVEAWCKRNDVDIQDAVERTRRIIRGALKRSEP